MTHPLFSIQHHAKLCVLPERKEHAQIIWEELSQDSPYHTFFDATVIDIDTARSIKLWGQTPSADQKTALISFHTITVPAQNALLKIVEEPPQGVSFIFITSNKELLLPTLLSRLYEIKKDNETSHTSLTEHTKEFLTTKRELRMKLPYIKELLEKKDEEDRKEREEVRHFILALAETLPSDEARVASYKKELLECASYASMPSSSTKALLEYIALLLPVSR